MQRTRPGAYAASLGLDTAIYRHRRAAAVRAPSSSRRVTVAAAALDDDEDDHRSLSTEKASAPRCFDRCASRAAALTGRLLVIVPRRQPRRLAHGQREQAAARCIIASSSTPSTRRLLDGVSGSVRSTSPFSALLAPDALVDFHPTTSAGSSHGATAISPCGSTRAVRGGGSVRRQDRREQKNSSIFALCSVISKPGGFPGDLKPRRRARLCANQPATTRPFACHGGE